MYLLFNTYYVDPRNRHIVFYKIRHKTQVKYVNNIIIIAAHCSSDPLHLIELWHTALLPIQRQKKTHLQQISRMVSSLLL